MVTATLGSSVAAGYTAVIESAFTLVANMGQAGATGLPATITSGDVIACALAAANASGFIASISGSSGQVTLTPDDINAIAAAVIAAMRAAYPPIPVHAVTGNWPTATENADALLGRTWP
ncbi:MAG: hypothetical protein A2Y38_16590 [Spirochaetes bacterium GWB1_59_5]|nr:MAG: hypothetical protein A2Y38_16590 [Spirochaetes bacterium GWB1_59_5]